MRKNYTAQRRACTETWFQRKALEVIDELEQGRREARQLARKLGVSMSSLIPIITRARKRAGIIRYYAGANIYYEMKEMRRNG